MFRVWFVLLTLDRYWKEKFDVFSYALWAGPHCLPFPYILRCRFKCLTWMAKFFDGIYHVFKKHVHRFYLACMSIYMYQALDTIIISFGFFYIYFAANGKINFSCVASCWFSVICSIHFHFISPYNWILFLFFDLFVRNAFVWTLLAFPGHCFLFVVHLLIFRAHHFQVISKNSSNSKKNEEKMEENDSKYSKQMQRET